ncbi:hypothetical protein PIB30_071347 [Stylosanthes scabra]|uniref:Uncharacterized protein n=1 Tax=Stylosanthes scabra TaxID=79078 RepID=A0ABU6WRK3_9FABA|nr:hypothetical protein [Stylosanthes scabra]
MVSPNLMFNLSDVVAGLALLRHCYVLRLLSSLEPIVSLLYCYCHHCKNNGEKANVKKGHCSQKRKMFLSKPTWKRMELESWITLSQ